MTDAPAIPGIDSIRADDGVRLDLHRLGPEDGSQVLLIPGTFSNHTFWLGTRDTGFGRELAAAGYHVRVLDPRGHGTSQRPDPGQTWNFDDLARRDVPAALRAATDYARSSAIVIGHSAGGAAALAALAGDPELRRRVAALVVIGTPVPRLQPFRGLAARLARRITLALDHFPARRLGLGPDDELPGVMAQWMRWNIEGHWLAGDGTDYETRLAELVMPTLAIAGAGDRLFAPPRACRALFDRIGADDKTFLVCGRRTGFSQDFGHAAIIVHRDARTEVWPRILDWLGRYAD